MDWTKLADELRPKLNSDIEIVEPKQLTRELMEWYHQIDKKAFREELQYSDDEIAERWSKPNSKLIFVLENKNPIAVHLGYDSEKDSDAYYIDTLATNKEGVGIGSIITNFIREYAIEEDYTKLILDTEVINERGLALKKFYEKKGFHIVDEDKSGNITMECNLNQ